MYPEPQPVDTSLKLCVFLGSRFPFKIHQPVKCSWTLAHPERSGITNMDIWRGMWDGQKTDVSLGEDRVAGNGVGQINSSWMIFDTFSSWCWLNMSERTLSHLWTFNILIHPRYYLSTWHNLSGLFAALIMLLKTWFLGVEGMRWCLLKLQIPEPA